MGILSRIQDDFALLKKQREDLEAHYLAEKLRIETRVAQLKAIQLKLTPELLDLVEALGVEIK